MPIGTDTDEIAGQAPAGTPDGQAPEGTTPEPEGEKKQTLDVDALTRELKALRKENASWRLKLREVETVQEEKQRAEMTEIEKLKADLDKERKARVSVEEKAKIQLVRSKVFAAASKLGFNDPEDAFRMIDVSKYEPDEDGTIEGLDDALAELVKSKPYLTKQAPPESGKITPTNPAGGTGKTPEEALRRELFGRPDPNFLTGGGVVWNSGA